MNTVKEPSSTFDYSPVLGLLEDGDISGWFNNNTGGPHLQAFEKRFAHFCEAKHAVACSSGSAAIYVALRALGIQGGDLVAVPAYTHIGSVAPIVLAGARPLFVDVDEYGNIEPDDLHRALHLTAYRGKVRAIVVVHMLGMPCRVYDLPPDIPVVEDASHALGSVYKGSPAGTLGALGCFSIGGGRTKAIGTGEGGMIITRDDDLAERCRNIRNHGDRTLDAPYLCFNFRMSDLNALIGLIQMEKVGFLLSWQMKNADYIIENLPPSLEVLPDPSPDVSSTRYLVGCRFNEEKAGMTRDEFLQRVRNAGFEGGVPRRNVGPGIRKLVQDAKFYRRWRRFLPMSRSLVQRSVWIDWHRWPRTMGEIDQLLGCFRGILR